MVAALANHGFGEQKDPHRRVAPHEVPAVLQRHFLRGVFDGDGCWHGGSAGLGSG